MFFKKLYLSFLIVVLPVDVEAITKEDAVIYTVIGGIGWGISTWQGYRARIKNDQLVEQKRQSDLDPLTLVEQNRLKEVLIKNGFCTEESEVLQKILDKSRRPSIGGKYLSEAQWSNYYPEVKFRSEAKFGESWGEQAPFKIAVCVEMGRGNFRKKQLLAQAVADSLLATATSCLIMSYTKQFDKSVFIEKEWVASAGMIFAPICGTMVFEKIYRLRGNNTGRLIAGFRFEKDPKGLQAVYDRLAFTHPSPENYRALMSALEMQQALVSEALRKSRNSPIVQLVGNQRLKPIHTAIDQMPNWCKQPGQSPTSGAVTALSPMSTARAAVVQTLRP